EAQVISVSEVRAVDVILHEHRAAVRVQHRRSGTTHVPPRISDLLHSYLGPLCQHCRPMPNVEEEQAPTREMPSSCAEGRTQVLMGRLVADHMEECDNRVEPAANSRFAQVADSAAE